MEITEEMKRIHAAVQEFEAQGFWGMAEYLRNIIEGMRK